MTPSRRIRWAGLAAACAAVPMALAYRFALVYRVRAGYPRQHPPEHTPDELGLAWEEVRIPGAGDGPDLPGWLIPAAPSDPSDGVAASTAAPLEGPVPGVVLVHGWESARDRLLPHAQFLHAAGFHVLLFDVRGHGDHRPETLPVSAGEYAADARTAAAWLRRRPDVGPVALLGHSMGAAGALVAAASDPSIAAVVAVSTPDGPERLTRLTFRLANLPIPSPVAWPLAWLTTRVYLRPRGHRVASISASDAVRRIRVPVLLVHGAQDPIVPVADLRRLEARRRRSVPDAVTDVLVIPDGRHSWLYEFGAFRAGVARFLATALGGSLPAEDAAREARATRCERLPEPERLTVVDDEPGGTRSLLALFRRSETRLPSPPEPPAEVA